MSADNCTAPDARVCFRASTGNEVIIRIGLRIRLRLRTKLRLRIKLRVRLRLRARIRVILGLGWR